jgi:hypothetical protein
MSLIDEAPHSASVVAQVRHLMLTSRHFAPVQRHLMAHAVLKPGAASARPTAKIESLAPGMDVYAVSPARRLEMAVETVRCTDSAAIQKTRCRARHGDGRRFP